ncbi:MAG: discoidin domain-containing protein [Candidatus Marinimicrobia bacterium]|nr:discoidin domain-containing protein [Candidatus Neomarinimicrobiota bacterium]
MYKWVFKIMSFSVLLRHLSRVRYFLFFAVTWAASVVYGMALDTVYCSTADEIHTAFKNAQAGDRIIISPGVYVGDDSRSGNSRGTFFCGAEGTQRYPIYVQCADTAGSVGLAGETIESDYTLYVTGDCWVIDGLEIKIGSKGIMLDNANHTIIKNCSVHQIGQEGIHIRDGSQYCLIDQCHIYDTGLVTPGFGEGIYVGSAVNHWNEFQTHEHYTIIRQCTLGPDVRAESIDIKEATVGTIVENCIFDGTGITGEHYADSFIDAKGNHALIQNNVAFRKGNVNIVDAFQVHFKENVWGFDNSFVHNEVYFDDAAGYLVNVASGSAKISGNVRIPEGNLYRGTYSTFSNILPTIFMVSPTGSTISQIGEPVNFSAIPGDADGRIAFVDFYLDGEPVWKDVEPPYEFQLNDLSVGEHSCYAVVYDNVMQWVNSDTVIFRVEEEIVKYDKIPVRAVMASGSDINRPENAIDGDLATRWSVAGNNQWIQFDLESFCFVSYVQIAFYKGHQRRSLFDLQFSKDGINWKDVLTAVESAGVSEDFQLFNFADDSCRFVRYMGHGNSYNNYNSINEFEVFGYPVRPMSAMKEEMAVRDFKIHHNFPNPFNPVTQIVFELKTANHVRAEIFDVSGALVETLVSKDFQAGIHSLRWYAMTQRSGVYVCRLTSDNQTEILKMILIK